MCQPLTQSWLTQMYSTTAAARLMSMSSGRTCFKTSIVLCDHCFFRPSFWKKNNGEWRVGKHGTHGEILNNQWRTWSGEWANTAHMEKYWTISAGRGSGSCFKKPFHWPLQCLNCKYDGKKDTATSVVVSFVRHIFIYVLMINVLKSVSHLV